MLKPLRIKVRTTNHGSGLLQPDSCKLSDIPALWSSSVSPPPLPDRFCWSSSPHLRLRAPPPLAVMSHCGVAGGGHGRVGGSLCGCCAHIFEAAFWLTHLARPCVCVEGRGIVLLWCLVCLVEAGALLLKQTVLLYCDSWLELNVVYYSILILNYLHKSG